MIPQLMTWQRYFYTQFIKNILYCLASFYSLYIIVDMMTHLHDLSSGETAPSTWAIYYLASFSKRLDIFFPFSILIATIRCLYQAQQRGELIAMLASGTSRLTLMTPFLIVCAFCSLIVLVNTEVALPSAMMETNYIRESRFGEDDIIDETQPLRHILLGDSSRLLYHRYDPYTKTLLNVYWIQTTSEIYYIKRLCLAHDKPLGKWVDHIKRGENNQFQKIGSWNEYAFDQIQLDPSFLTSSVTPTQEQPISRLVIDFIRYKKTKSSRIAEIASTLYFKLTFPLMCLVAFLGPAPRLLRFGRVVPILMIYLLSIAGLFCLHLMFQAFFVLGKNNLLPASLAIIAPWIGLLVWLMQRLQKEGP